MKKAAIFLFLLAALFLAGHALCEAPSDAQLTVSSAPAVVGKTLRISWNLPRAKKATLWIMEDGKHYVRIGSSDNGFSPVMKDYPIRFETSGFKKIRLLIWYDDYSNIKELVKTIYIQPEKSSIYEKPSVTAAPPFNSGRQEQAGTYRDNCWNVLAVIVREINTPKYTKSITDTQARRLRKMLDDFPRTMEGLSDGRMRIGQMDIVEIKQPVRTLSGDFGDFSYGKNGDVNLDPYLQGKDYQLITVFAPLDDYEKVDWFGLGGFTYSVNGRDYYMLIINSPVNIQSSRIMKRNGQSYYVKSAVLIHETLHAVEVNSEGNGCHDFQPLHSADENGYSSEKYDYLDWYADLMTDSLKNGKKGFSPEAFIVTHYQSGSGQGGK